MLPVFGAKESEEIVVRRITRRLERYFFDLEKTLNSESNEQFSPDSTITERKTKLEDIPPYPDQTPNEPTTIRTFPSGTNNHVAAKQKPDIPKLSDNAHPGVTATNADTTTATKTGNDPQTPIAAAHNNSVGNTKETIPSKVPPPPSTVKEINPEDLRPEVMAPSPPPAPPVAKLKNSSGKRPTVKVNKPIPPPPSRQQNVGPTAATQSILLDKSDEKFEAKSEELDEQPMSQMFEAGSAHLSQRPQKLQAKNSSLVLLIVIFILTIFVAIAFFHIFFGKF